MPPAIPDGLVTNTRPGRVVSQVLPGPKDTAVTDTAPGRTDLLGEYQDNSARIEDEGAKAFCMMGDF